MTDRRHTPRTLPEPATNPDEYWGPETTDDDDDAYWWNGEPLASDPEPIVADDFMPF